MLEVSELEFSYSEKKILDGISFKAEKNSVVSILGPNGVGKTTLLNCICNFHKPSHGKITVDGVDTATLSGRELARKIGYVPQKASAKKSTVFDSVLIGRRPYIEWSATREDMEIAWNVLDAMGLRNMALDYVDEISGGEFQKVQIARALVQEPQVLILDEPTNNLDIANQHMTMGMIAESVEDRDVCTIMTMHDINLSIFYSDRLLFIKNGRVAAYGDHSVVTPELIKDVYGVDVDIIDHDGLPYVIPNNSYRSKRAGRKEVKI